MLEFITPDLSNRPSRRAGSSKSSKEGWLARLARRLLIRMDVGSSQRPATLYLSSVDLMPMGTWVVVSEEDQHDPETGAHQ
ncbi:MAG: hypothetical protein QGH80_02475 [Acidimicrobiales bacterium]|nr:hypothetical protein [Acidimicrobiales bacterium]